MNKTNAMRLLDKADVSYDHIEYDPDDGLSGLEVAKSTGEDPYSVFKTLVTESNTGENYVFVIPSTSELDLKKAAKLTNSKKIDMLAQKKLLALTGYVHGGCSPLAMKKKLKTYIDNSAKDKPFIYVSGGKRGLQIKVNPDDLKNICEAEFEDVKTSGK